MSPGASRGPRVFDWALWRAPVTGVAIVVLLGLGVAVLRGQWQLSKATIEETDAQDFGIFYASVRHAVEGQGLYAPLPPRRQPPYYSGQLNLNLPHTNLFFLPLAFLSPRQGLVGWAVASLVIFVWSTWASLRALRWRLPAVAWVALAVYLLAWGPAAAFSLTLQLSFLLMGPVTASWLAARAGRSTAAGAWLGIAASAKPFLLLVVLYLVLRRDTRALRACAVVSLLFVLAGLVVFGPHSYVDWAMQLPRVSWASHYMNASLGGLVERLFGSKYYGGFGDVPSVKLFALPIVSLAVGVVTLRAAVRPPRSAAGEDHAWAVLLLAAILLSPLGWVYYLWIALWPVTATIGHQRPWHQPSVRDGWLVPGLGGWLWFRRMAAWGQPSAMATATFASMYFWALVSLWWWCLGTRALDTRGSEVETGSH
jgi:hypothetical protein